MPIGEADQIFSRIALVGMPWVSVRRPSLALPILKGCAERAGFTTDVHLLTMRLAELIGIDCYERISDHPFYPEWFFSQALFGANGTGELKNDWDYLKADRNGQHLRDAVLYAVNGSAELLNQVLNEAIPQFIENCLTEIDWQSYGVVGFTTVFAQSFASALLAKRIKERFPHISIVFGGANVDGEMGVEFLKAFPWVDHVVHGEGEVVFPSLLRSLASGRPQKIESVSSRIGGQILRGDGDHPPFVDLNSTPVPDYSHYMEALEKSLFKKDVISSVYFESSRGCWWGAKHHCTFCGLNATGMSFRKKDAKRVFDEIMEITWTTKCLDLFATDNIFPLEYFNELLPRLIEADLDISIFYETKANLTRDQMALLAKAGVRSIQPGIESFTTKILSHMQKGITAIQNIQFVKWCKELGISAAYNVIYGFPGETAEDYASYPKLFQSIEHLQPPSNIGPVNYQRFSPYHMDATRFGLDLEAHSSYTWLYPTDRVRLDGIAYFFQERGGKEPTFDYMAPTLSAFEVWKRRSKKAFFSCHKGPGYILLQDSRSFEGDDSARPEMRQITIAEPGASIYLYCDQNRSLNAVCAMVREKFSNRYSTERVEKILNEMVQRKLMYSSDNRFLALAVSARQVRRPTESNEAVPM